VISADGRRPRTGRKEAATGDDPAAVKLLREDASKPTPAELGIDPGRQAWARSGEGDGSIEIAFPVSFRWTRGDWVLMRVVGDPAARILVFDRNEWECFLDGARSGEFDHAAHLAGGSCRLVP
jgi:hypothetical protein